MSFKFSQALQIIEQDSVKFKVVFTLKDEKGADVPFDFVLHCKRKTHDQVLSELRQIESDASLASYLVELAFDWEGVRDDESKPMQFAPDRFLQLCKIDGLPGVILASYLSEVKAKAKN